jgi:hypothetical protein
MNLKERWKREERARLRDERVNDSENIMGLPICCFELVRVRAVLN